MPGLMLHCGAQPATLEQLRMVPTPTPTRTHVPVPHAEVIDQVVKLAKCEGLTIQDQSFGIQDGRKDENGQRMPGAKMFGLMTVGLPDDMPDGLPETDPNMAAAQQLVDREFAVTLGIRNSHDKSFRFELVLGSRVFVCDNLCFSGELSVCRKHTGGIRNAIVPAILEGFARLPETVAGQNLRLERYKALELEVCYANDYFVRCMQAGVFAPNRIQAVVNEYHDPQHDHGGRTLWAGFNAVTEILKGTETVKDGETKRTGGTNVFDLPQVGRCLHAVTDSYAREILGDTLTPEPDAAIVDYLRKSPARALSLI